jgi:chemotaxis protein MotB
MRKKPEKKHQNLERWIISYADFMTLLLATFVVMYAVSSINSGKFQEMAEAFSTAFIGKITPVQASGLAAGHKAPFDFMPSPVHTPIITRDVQIKKLPPALREAVELRARKLDEAYQKLIKLLGPMIKKGQVRVSLQSLGVVIDINEVVLFRSGKAELTPEALTIVDEVESVLKDLNYPIQVNGFTDNAPIHTAQFDSNWDLSAARAIAVVKRFAADGIVPTLLVGAGYGEYHPVSSNDTPQGMAMNRRVSIAVVAPQESKGILQTPLSGPPKNPAGESDEVGPEAGLPLMVPGTTDGAAPPQPAPAPAAAAATGAPAAAPPAAVAPAGAAPR